MKKVINTNSLAEQLHLHGGLGLGENDYSCFFSVVSLLVTMYAGDWFAEHVH